MKDFWGDRGCEQWGDITRVGDILESPGTSSGGHPNFWLEHLVSH